MWLELVAGWLLPASIASWVQADAQRRGAPFPYDLASFVFLIWPVAAPFYLLRTRGWRGCGPIALGGVIVIATMLIEVALLLARAH